MDESLSTFSSSPSKLGDQEASPPSFSSSVTVLLNSSSSLIVTFISASDLTFSRFVELSDTSGEVRVGGIFVPADLVNQANTTLIASYTDRFIDSSNSQELSSIVLNITLLDGQGNFITELDSPLTICFAAPNGTKRSQNLCLSFYDERKNKWRCEDECLTTGAARGVNASNAGADGENLLCGQTSHLTNFALLLIGGDGEAPCLSGKGNTFAWISLGMVGGAILAVSLSVVAIEINFRRTRYQTDRKLKVLTDAVGNQLSL